MMLWDVLYDYVLPGFLITIMVGVFFFAPALTKLIAKWFRDRGVPIEESRQRMFQTALENGALAVIRRAGGGAITPLLIEHGVRHVQEGAPDQVKHFGVSPEKIASVVKDKVDDKLRHQHPAVVVASPEIVSQGPKPERRVAGSAAIVR